MIRIIILSLFIFFQPGSYLLAQLRDRQIIDSLEKLVVSNNTEKKNIENLCRLSEASFILQYDKGISYGNQALELSTRVKNLSLQARAYQAIGKNYWGKSNYPEALRFHVKALDIYTTLKDFRGMVTAYMQIASTSFAQNQLNQSEAFYKKALILTQEKIHDTLLLAGKNGIMPCLAMTYLSMGKFDQQINILKEADLLLLKSGMSRERVAVFSLLADAAINQHQPDKAMAYLTDGYTLAQKEADLLACGKIKDQMAFLEKTNSHFSSSIVHSRKALEYFEAISEQGHIARTHANIGQTILKSLQQKINPGVPDALNTAISNLEQAVKIATPISSLIVLQEYESSLAEAYGLKGDYKKALEAYKLHRVYLDSLNDQNRQRDFYKQLLELEFKKQQDSLMMIKNLDAVKLKNAAQKSQLKTEHIRQLWLYFILALLLILSISWAFYQKKKNRIRELNMFIAGEKIKKEKEENALEKKINELTLTALQSQLNPHFIFNALNSIKLFIEVNQKEAAAHYLSRIATMIRKMLDATTKETNTISEEIELLQLYLDLESLRLKEKLSWSIHVDPSLDKEMIQLPSMFLQPVVENSIWHGLMQLEKGGHVNIDIREQREDNKLVIIITDNGIGMNESKRQSETGNKLHRSRGLEIMRQRLRAFNEKYHKTGSIEIVDRKEINQETGTRVTITMDII